MASQEPTTSSSTSTMHNQTSPTQKRTRDPAARTSLPRRTRIKLSPPDSISVSGLSETEHDALIPTSHSSESTATSLEESESDSELSESSEDTSSASSSDEDSSEDEEDEEVSDGGEHSDGDARINIIPGVREKPKKEFVQDEGYKALKARLNAFLPQLAAANEDLERQRKAGALKTLEVDDDAEGEFIELNLGLGVLEEKNPNSQDCESEGEESEDSGEDMDTKQYKEKDILGKLLGQDRKNDGGGIQEVGGT